MNDLSGLIGELSPEQLELLRLKVDKISSRAAGPARVQLVARTDEIDTFPLSFAQQRFWFLHQLYPDSSAYNIPFAVRLKGPLNVTALEQVFRELLRRHKVLNTSFTSQDGQPVQVIAPAYAGPVLVTEDLRQLEAGEREAQMWHLVTENSQRPFDLTRAPLLRARLLRLSNDEQVLVLAVDHIATDAGSAGILLQELTALYHAFVMGQPSPLPKLPFQYADFAAWQRQWLEGKVIDSQLAYWRQQLAGAPRKLDLPTDRARSRAREFQSASYSLELPQTLAAGIRDFSQREGVTLFMTLFTAFAGLLYLYTKQQDIVVATPISNRNRPEFQNLIGCFINHLLMRTILSSELSLRELLYQVRETTLNAHANQDLPFERLVAELQPDRTMGDDPLLRVVFNFYDSRLPELSLTDLQVEPLDLKLGTGSDLDLRVVDTGRTLVGAFRYNPGLFEAQTIEQLAVSLAAILEAIIERPETKLSHLALTDELKARVEAARLREQPQTITIAATFTADPIQESVAFWMRELDVPARIELAPYNQILQQLLDPSSQLSQQGSGINVILLRLGDWQFQSEERETRHDTEASSLPDLDETLDRNLRDFVLALRSAAARSPRPFVVCLCPSAPAGGYDQMLGPRLLQRAEQSLVSEFADVAGVYLVTESELFETYPVASYHDAYADKLGHVPFRPDFFTALGTLIARKICALRNTPYKVLVLDGDQTLWKGVVGEDGVPGIEIDAPHAALQQFVVDQQRAGMLVCVCSKNNEEDVMEVFRQHPEMPLRREHLVAARINWKAKSENLKSLATQLQLGLESFVFIDDDPVECAEVGTRCPEVLTLQLPRETDTFARFLKHVWAFDRLKLTDEDRQRTVLYRQNVERERFREQSMTFQDFLSSLELKIEIDPLESSELGRVAQLIRRTNQFNTTTIRLTEGELQSLCRRPEVECQVVRVRDRFGDYGLVGALFTEAGPESIKISVLLLSCRVLGRGVEHKMLFTAARMAEERGLARVDVPYFPTERNLPALSFLESVGAKFRAPEANGYIFKLPVEVAAAVSYQAPAESSGAPGRFGRDLTGSPAPSSDAAHLPAAVVRRIATELFDAGKINQAIEEQNLRVRPAGVESFVAPRTPVEEKLAEIWKRNLGVERIGIHDNFFKLGGHSLQGTLLMSRVRDAFQVELPLLTLFDAPTVAGLAQAIKLRQVEHASAEELSELLEGMDELSDEEVRAFLAAEQE
jgi:FkbH-like protein